MRALSSGYSRGHRFIIRWNPSVAYLHRLNVCKPKSKAGRARVIQQVDNEEWHYHITPEQRLLYGLLIRSILDLGLPESEKRIRADALGWFMSRSPEPWGFIWVCEHLDINPTRLYYRLSELYSELDWWCFFDA